MTNRYITVKLTDHDCAGRTPTHVLACSHTRMPAAGKVEIYRVKRRKYSDLREVRRA
ncbi:MULTISPECIES: hypothetical protein [unclassified Marinobacter]|uniref:hypothetical protein n=1 Tax=unclassified Marinobacter TaxID=83889 RepID=UPI0019255F2A|nr:MULTISPECIES: hypothetical protein [unclassified Marinobacter]MBL3825113.1 hypothetical protein [Marinobacter sp. MC3]MBL3893683.1 hypothetical protein [Marinobacter sp. MW3]